MLLLLALFVLFIVMSIVVRVPVRSLIVIITKLLCNFYKVVFPMDSFIYFFHESIFCSLAFKRDVILQAFNCDVILQTRNPSHGHILFYDYRDFIYQRIVGCVEIRDQ